MESIFMNMNMNMEMGIAQRVYNPSWLLTIAGSFALISLSLSFCLLFHHLRNYRNPKEQKWVVGVIFIVPVYTIESFLSLRNPNISVECDILRSCYEAFALYSFGNYLIACFGGEEQTIEFLESLEARGSCTSLLNNGNGKADLRHPPPLNFLIRPWVLGREFLKFSKFGIVQYMILKSFCALLSLVLELFNAYGDGKFEWNYGYPYIIVVLNFSQTWALYCLVQFYAVTHEELRSIHPLSKFICFKAIVFATWWQGVFIALFFSLGFTPNVLRESAKAETSIQNFLICIEMAIAAIAHTFVFPVSPYQLRFDLSQLKILVQSEQGQTNELLITDEKDDESSITQDITINAKNSTTSIKESVQDIVLGGGEHVVHDVKITVSQAVGPVEKGITKLNETLHHMSWLTTHEDGCDIGNEEVIQTESLRYDFSPNPNGEVVMNSKDTSEVEP